MSVRVVEARDLMPMDLNGKSDPYVVLKFGARQSQKTNYINSDLNPVWNEVFTFDVESGKEELEVIAYDRDDFGKDDFLGRFRITMDEYRDQQMHDEWFELMPDDPKMQNQWHGRVRLVIQLVYSRTRYLTGVIQMWTERIQIEEQELQELRTALYHMEAPFGFIKGFQMEQRAISMAQ